MIRRGVHFQHITIHTVPYVFTQYLRMRHGAKLPDFFLMNQFNLSNGKLSLTTATIDLV